MPKEQIKYAKNGLYNKFILLKHNGKPINPDARYFVLRYDDQQKDPDFARACRKALMTFMSEISGKYPALAKDLFKDLKDSNTSQYD